MAGKRESRSRSVIDWEMNSAGLMVETRAESMGRQTAEKRAQSLARTTAAKMARLMAETRAKSLDALMAVMMGCSMGETRAGLVYLETHWAGMSASLTWRGSLTAENWAWKRWKDSVKAVCLAVRTAAMWASQTLRGAH